MRSARLLLCYGRRGPAFDFPIDLARGLAGNGAGVVSASSESGKVDRDPFPRGWVLRNGARDPFRTNAVAGGIQW